VSDSAVDADVAIVGAGAAGLATAIFLRRDAPDARVLVLDGARRPGAKILVSGGSRCNVTNRDVTDADFNGGPRPIVRRILRALPVPATIDFFAGLGVALHEEPTGKLFPDTNRARDVLDVLLRELTRSGAVLRAGTRVETMERAGPAFRLVTSAGPLSARAVVLATGGLSLPKTGSDGWGLGAAKRMGHSIVQTTPALAPLVLDAGSPDAIHGSVSGVSLPVRLDLVVDDVVTARVSGALLWTHFGVSGPAALDMSRHWLRAELEGRRARLTLSVCPEDTFDSLDRRWTTLARDRPRAFLVTALADFVPASVAAAMIGALGLPPDRTLAAFGREDRRRLVHALTAWPLAVTSSRGYAYAEVTAGGVPLDEIRSESMESRLVPGLFFVGEILDVDGRIGGFNFQWAWSSARVAARALAARVAARHH
jgi:hypothetical protein